MTNFSENPANSPARKPQARQKIKRGSASMQLHNSLCERIISLELEPGQFLSRAEIASEYSVSQTPVRDALIRLEEEGLIVTFPQSKTEVSRIDVEHALETHFLRLSVELEIGNRLVAQNSPDTCLKARSILAQQAATLGAGDLDSFARLDRDFHFALFEATGMENLYAVIDARSGHIDRLRNLNLPDPGKPNSVLECHGKILDAIEAGNKKATQAAIREHLSGTLAKIDVIKARYPLYF